MTSETTATREVPAAPTFGEAVRVWAKIGLLGFGGPAGQIALMHKELVEQRRWIGEQRFLHALNYCMLLPGPEAQQLATYIGWLLHRTKGGMAAGLLFILPGALVMLALSALYALYREVPLVAAVFYGIKAAVLAIVVEAVLRIGRRALKTRELVWIAVAGFVAIAVFKIPFPLIVLGAALIGWIGGRAAPESFAQTPHGTETHLEDKKGAVDVMFERGELKHAEPSTSHALRVLAVGVPLWIGPIAVLWFATGAASVWTQIGTFFSTMAVVTFGGAYAVLAYVAQAAVGTYGWLAPGEMMDGLGLAETTPGPLILVLQFVGFLAGFRAPGALDPLIAGGLGALLTLWVTFAPCFLWIFLGAPYIEALRSNAVLSSALAAVTAAVVGIILNLAVWFGMHVIFREIEPVLLPGLGRGPDVPTLASIDLTAAALSVAALVAVLRFRVGMAPILIACALAGMAIHGLQGV